MLDHGEEPTRCIEARSNSHWIAVHVLMLVGHVFGQQGRVHLGHSKERAPPHLTAEDLVEDVK
jgi:hypothetical protein